MLTETELLNAERDVADLAAVVTGTRFDPDIVTRSGTVVKPLAKVLYLLATTVLTPPDYIGPPGPPGGDASSIGLLKDASTMAIGAGINVVRTTGNESLGFAIRAYFKDATFDNAELAAYPKAGFHDSGGQRFRITRDEVFIPQSQYLATDPDNQNMMQRSFDYLRHIATGAGGGGFYRGSQRLFCPQVAGPGEPRYIMHAPLEINHNLIWEGEGSANGSPESFSATGFHWPDGTDFVRIQGAGTSGQNTVDGPAHDGVGGMIMRNMGLFGPQSNTMAMNHAIVQRSIAHFDDIYIRGCQGIGIRGWTGNVDGVNYGGNISCSTYRNVKVERSMGTMSFRGTDSNVLLTECCQGYQNMQFGLVDGNAAGANSHNGWHCTYNGIAVPAGGPYTQCSHGGNIYTPNIDYVDTIGWSAANLAALQAGLAANAPSGDATSNTWWVYCFPGAPDISSGRPAWASGGPFIWGGDYLALSPWQIIFNNCYMEGGGGRSQSRYRHPLFIGGTLDVFQGTLVTSTDDAYEIIREGAANLILKFRTQYGGGSIAIQRFGQPSPIWYVSSSEAGVSTYWTPSSHHFYTQSGASLIDVAQIYYPGIDLAAGKVLSQNGTPILSGRMAAIADLAGGATLADVIAKQNDLLAKLRGVAILTT